MPVVIANSVDPDQPRSAASGLGLHCLPMSHLWDAKHKWVKPDVFVLFLFFCFVFCCCFLFCFLFFYICRKMYV